MRTNRVSIVFASAAYILAWAAVFYVVLVASYTGESVEATPAGDPVQTAASFVEVNGVYGIEPTVPSDPVQTTASFVEVNGLYGLAVALTPMLLTAFALIGALAIRDRTTLRMVVLWVTAIAVGAFCFAAILSIGLLYVPAAIALIGAAVADIAHRPGEV